MANTTQQTNHLLSERVINGTPAVKDSKQSPPNTSSMMHLSSVSHSQMGKPSKMQERTNILKFKSVLMFSKFFLSKLILFHIASTILLESPFVSHRHCKYLNEIARFSVHMCCKASHHLQKTAKSCQAGK